MKLRHLGSKLLTEHHEDTRYYARGLVIKFYDRICFRVFNTFRSITFPAPHLPRLILNYRIVDLSRDFKDSHGNEAKRDNIDVLGIRSGWC
jgi:hypothetical protein